jgi:hypothetical protein
MTRSARELAHDQELAHDRRRLWELRDGRRLAVDGPDRAWNCSARSRCLWVSSQRLSGLDSW